MSSHGLRQALLQVQKLRLKAEGAVTFLINKTVVWNVVQLFPRKLCSQKAEPAADGVIGQRWGRAGAARLVSSRGAAAGLRPPGTWTDRCPQGPRPALTFLLGHLAT